MNPIEIEDSPCIVPDLVLEFDSGFEVSVSLEVSSEFLVMLTVLKEGHYLKNPDFWGD